MHRGSLVSIRVRAADPAWLSFLHLSLCTTQSIKTSLKNKVTDEFHESLAPLCQFYLSLSLSLSLSFPLFFRLIPWSTKALCIHVFAWASKTWPGRCSVSSLLQETETVPVAYVNRASPSSGVLLAFCVNQGISSLHSILSLPSPIADAVPPEGIPGSNQGWSPVIQH